MQGKTLPRTEKTTEKSRTKFSTGIWEIGSRGKDLAAKNTANGNAPAEVSRATKDFFRPAHPPGGSKYVILCLFNK